MITSRWAVILCKFNDDYTFEPKPRQYYEDIFTSSGEASQRDMVRYFRDYSHGKLDLGGTKVFGWYLLDKSVADYNALEYARYHLIQWARAAAEAAGEDLSGFVGVVACTNLWHDIGGGSDGVVSQGPTTVPQLLAHEMGHLYGLNHSRIHGSLEDYQDPWDVMSAATTYSAEDPEFGLIGPGLNACNMRFRDWLDESRVWKGADKSGDHVVTLRPLVARELPGYLAADLPGGYVAELRLKEGWDGAIPRAAVLVHRFEFGVSYLMSSTAGEPDLVQGEVFHGSADPAADHMMEVLSIDPVSQTAVLRIHCPEDAGGGTDGNPGRGSAGGAVGPSTGKDLQAIDPMALILSGDAYLIWVELHHPHEPAGFSAVVRTLPAQERRAALARAGELVETGRLVQSTMAELAGTRPRGNLLSRLLLRLSRWVGG